MPIFYKHPIFNHSSIKKYIYLNLTPIFLRVSSKYTTFSKKDPLVLGLTIYIWPIQIININLKTKKEHHYEENYFYFIINK